MLFSISLAEKLGKRGLQSYSLHPGGIFSTALSSHLEQPSATGLGDFESLSACQKHLTYEKNVELTNYRF